MSICLGAGFLCSCQASTQGQCYTLLHADNIIDLFSFKFFPPVDHHLPADTRDGKEHTSRSESLVRHY